MCKRKNSMFRVFKTEEGKVGAHKVSRHFKTFLFGCQLHWYMGSWQFSWLQFEIFLLINWCFQDIEVSRLSLMINTIGLSLSRYIRFINRIPKYSYFKSTVEETLTKNYLIALKIGYRLWNKLCRIFLERQLNWITVRLGNLAANGNTRHSF